MVMTSANDALQTLSAAVKALGEAGEQRTGQQQMCEAVANAMASKRHLVVAAGTGTGKSLAYLVPLALSDGPCVVATATKTLQDQLTQKDLPQLSKALNRPINFAVLKGRSNYLCMQRLSELANDKQLSLDTDDGPRADIAKLTQWAQRTKTGDRDELHFAPSARAWNALSVSGRECPGAQRCPSGMSCFAEKARDTAAAADIVVVNIHLYCLHVFGENPLLPEHETVVIDEAHVLEDIVSDTAGVTIASTRFDDLSRRLQGVVAESTAAKDIGDVGQRLHDALEGWLDKSLPTPLPKELQQIVVLARGRTDSALAELRAIPNDAPEELLTKKTRATKLASALADDLNRAMQTTKSEVAWVEANQSVPTWKIAPIQLGTLLTEKLWQKTTAVLTSATIPMNLGENLGLHTKDHDAIDVGSPFDYANNALLYCAKHLPDPRKDGYQQALHTELAALIDAAAGRTLGLFTSYRAMEQAAEALRPKLDVHIYTQRDLPKAELLRRFANEVESCLFATMSFWQGVDVPGESLSLVTIDRLPFPRPDDPLLNARRELHDKAAFMRVDVPLTATRLAQGAGRLIRRSTDRGVVAVLDSRLASARYRWNLIEQLPPFKRTAERSEAVALLQSIRQPA